MGNADAGTLKVVTGTNPIAGQEVSDTVPFGKFWRLLAAEVTFVTSAAAASRFPKWVIDDGTTEVFRSSTPAAQTLSLTEFYQLCPGLGTSTFPAAGANAIVQSMCPSPLWLGPGFRIRTLTGSIDTGDDYGAPAYLVVEYVGGMPSVSG